ncbi:cation diffusion facilitator family transporter [Nesterenkonia sp.]|uniref:cation diffusion facilitator family transporter n=1 Tax=Nesterenkonia sp. TaxID=704201 RepID=UPI00261EBF09|nr:cation diffusion facilitator family transporter [Nesterenkonia sp.]
MSFGHQHSHSDPAAADYAGHRDRLLLCCAVTAAVVAAQAVGAWLTGSLALLTDAVHSAADSIGLVAAVTAAGLMLRAPSSSRTWGYRRAEILAGLLQAALLLSMGVYAVVEGVQRLSSPQEIPSVQLLAFAAAGLVGNLISLRILAGVRRENLSVRAAFLEVFADALGSAGVMAAAVIIWLTGWQQADSVAALLIAGVIIPRAAVLLRETGRILLEFAPRGLDVDQVRQHILQIDHVQDVHDLHASTVATGLPVLSAHVVLDDECFTDGCAPEKLAELRSCVAEHFDVAVEHATFQLETAAHARTERSTHA